MSEAPKPNNALDNPKMNAINQKLAQQVEKLIQGIAVSAGTNVEKYYGYLTETFIQMEIATQETCDQFFSMRKMNQETATDYLNNLFLENPEAWLFLRSFIESLWATSESEYQTGDTKKNPTTIIETATTWAGEEAMRIIEFQYGLDPKKRGQA